MDWNVSHYKNLIILAGFFLLSFIFGAYEPFHEILFWIGYPAAFFAGVIFAYTFGTPISAVFLLILAEKFPLPQLLLVAGVGAIISNFTIFSSVKDGVSEDLEPIYENLENHQLRGILRSKHFKWLFPVVGGALILTPLPHEIGLNLIGIHKLKTVDFLATSAFVNVIGILFILLLSLVIKP